MGLDEAFLRSNFASALLDLDRPGEALKEARAAVALDPTHGHSQRTLVATLLATGDTDAALAAWRAADSQVVDGREVLANNIAWGLFEAGRAPEGLEILEGSLATSPEPVTSADAADTYGHLLAAASRPEEAVKAFLKAVDLGGPERQSLYEARLAGLGLLAGGDLAAALGACAATGSACRLAD
jgi:tetratricopeptide (TPR) repeat protein